MARIMILEDDEQVRGFLERALQGEGHEVVSLEDGTLAGRVHRERPVDLVITDLFMPHTNGLEAMSELLSLSPGLRVIAMSGGGGPTGVDAHSSLDTAARMGACQTLQKPFGLRILCESVSCALEGGPAH